MMMEIAKNSFEIAEEKSIKNTMLFIKGLSINEEGYETKILLEDNIENVLKFHIVYDGDSSYYRFDVSNTISLEEFIKSHKLKKKDICFILDSIDNMLSTIENYLIEENSISLDLKLVRVSKITKNSFKLSFIIIPNLKSSFSYELSKFLIKILRHVDIEDKNALKLAYGLFVRSSKDNYTINDLMELVNAARDKNANGFNDIDIDALNDYDEEMISEMHDEIVESDFREGMPELCEFIDAEKGIENVINSNEQSSGNLDINMDAKTDSILKNQLLENFDSESKTQKVIKFKKKIFEFKPRKSFNAHIILNHLNVIFIPIVCILIPWIIYFFYGIEKFVSMIPLICLCEVAVVTMFAIKRIRGRK